jgi:hypothetical protein
MLFDDEQIEEASIATANNFDDKMPKIKCFFSVKSNNICFYISLLKLSKWYKSTQIFSFFFFFFFFFLIYFSSLFVGLNSKIGRACSVQQQLSIYS